MPSDTDTWGPQNSKLKTKQPNQTRSNGEYGNHQANGRLHNRVPEALKTLEHSLALPFIERVLNNKAVLLPPNRLLVFQKKRLA